MRFVTEQFLHPLNEHVPAHGNVVSTVLEHCGASPSGGGDGSARAFPVWMCLFVV